tara:strand:+ start:2385 stop:3950 length:1566 start_codon:yes stop_codon:yes gene_type:complete
MKYLFLFAFLCLIQPVNIFSQKYNVQWGEMEQEPNNLIAILPISGGNFLSIRQSRRLLTVAKHENFSVTATGRISTKLKGNVALFEDVKLVNNQLVVFLSDRREGKDLFFMQKYDQDLKISGDGILLASYDLERGYSRGDYKVITSQNNKYFAVIWNVPGRNDIQDKYGFKVFDENMTEISEGDYKLPFEGKLSAINEHYLSNTGDYFISVTEYSEPESKKLFKSYLNYKALHLFHVTPDLMDQFTIDLNGRRVETMTMNSDNNNLFTLSGVYGETLESGVAGLFYMRLDFENNTVLNQGFEKFDKNFITQDWSFRQKERADKLEAKGKGEPELHYYQMRQSEVLADGSIVGSLEQYYVVTNTYYDGRGASRNMYTYYYKDIIAFKIGVSGGFDWLKKIDKQQVSTNDGGPFSSYSRFVDGSKIVFVFNDNSDNYATDGRFINSGGGNIYEANFGTRKNVVAIVTIDLFSGAVGRETFFSRDDVETIAVPKLFNVDYERKEVLLYGINRRDERFGLLKLGN